MSRCPRAAGRSRPALAPSGTRAVPSRCLAPAKDALEGGRFALVHGEAVGTFQGSTKIRCARLTGERQGVRVPWNEGVTNHVSPRAVRRSSRGVNRRPYRDWGQSSRHRRLNAQTSASNARSPFTRRTVSQLDPTDLGASLSAVHGLSPRPAGRAPVPQGRVHKSTGRLGEGGPGGGGPMKSSDWHEARKRLLALDCGLMHEPYQITAPGGRGSGAGRRAAAPA